MERNPFAIDQEVIKTLYRRYRNFAVPVGIIVICILLVFFVIIPQFENLQSMQKEEAETREKIAVLKENAIMLGKISDVTQNNEFRIALKSLPVEKDFVGILEAISTTSQKAGVSIGDFSFQVGSVSFAKGETQGTTIGLTISIFGGISEARQFLTELAKSMPISEVKSANIDPKTSGLSIQFHYRPIGFSAIDFTTPIKQTTKKDQEVITLLSSWESAF